MSGLILSPKMLFSLPAVVAVVGLSIDYDIYIFSGSRRLYFEILNQPQQCLYFNNVKSIFFLCAQMF